MDKKNKIKLNTPEKTFVWDVLNLSRATDVQDKFISAVYDVDSVLDLNFVLTLFPRGVNVKHANYVGLFIDAQSSNNLTVEAKFSFFILNRKKENINQFKGISVFDISKGTGGGTPRFIPFPELSKQDLVKNDKLTIVCKIHSGINLLNSPANEKLLNGIVNPLLDDFGKLMEKPSLSDVILIAHKREFHVHKVILSARSPVFEAMFKNEIKLVFPRKVHINGTDPRVLQEMLRFIYTGSTDNIQQIARDLLILSSRYQVASLTRLCEDVLCEQINLNNVANRLILAKSRQLDKLKKTAIDFITNNPKAAIGTRGFQRLESLHPSLIGEVFRALALKQAQ